MAEDIRAASDDELAQTLLVPAVFANRFYFTGLGAVSRLTFGEQQSSPDGDYTFCKPVRAA